MYSVVPVSYLFVSVFGGGPRGIFVAVSGAREVILSFCLLGEGSPRPPLIQGGGPP